MAKMTKAQKELAEIHEREERRERERFSYTPKLLMVVGRAMRADLGIAAEVNPQNEGKFFIYGEWDTYELPLDYSSDNYYELERAEQEVVMAEERRAEAERLDEVRKQAIAKLSDEERKVLGV